MIFLDFLGVPVHSLIVVAEGGEILVLDETWDMSSVDAFISNLVWKYFSRRDQDYGNMAGWQPGQVLI